MDSRIIKKERIYKFCLISILIFSGFIYFYNLNKESLLTDEYFSLYSAQQPLNTIIFGHQKEFNPNSLPPLYEIIMHFWLKIFGLSEFAQRSFSAILGIISAYIIYRVACLLFDIPTGILTALFGSLSFSWFCFFRQNRCYSLFICLTLLSFYLFFYYLKNKESKFSLPFLIAINIALTYTHYFAFLVILLELLFSIFEYKRNIEFTKDILLMCLWAFFAYGPWYSNFFYDINREPLMTIRLHPIEIGLQLFSIILVLFSDFHIKWEPLLTILYLPLIVMGWIKLSKEKNNHFRYRLLYLVLIFTTPFLIIYSVTSSDRIRYYAPFSFPLLILLALGIQKINTQKLKKFLLLPMVVFIVVFNFIDFCDFFRNPLNENWKQAAQYIKQIPDYKNEEMVFVFQTKHNPPVFAYYYWGNKIARSFIDNIVNYENYDKDLSAIETKHKVYLISDDIREEEFIERLDSFPDNAWIWVFRYHDLLSPFYFRIQNNGRYFFHEIILNKEMPQIDFCLLKKIK